MHGVVFSDSCSEVTLLSNVHFNDDVVTAVDELRGRTPASKVAKFLTENLSAIFAIDPSLPAVDACDILQKLSLRPGVSYISEERSAFANAARAAIHKYSEIDLTYHETTELANGLVSLVYQKSQGSRTLKTGQDT